MTYTHVDSGDVALFTNTDGLIGLLTNALGSAPVVKAIEDAPGYEFNLTSYDWSGITVVAGDDRASISATAATVNGIIIDTAQGIGVGSTRADVLKAGATPGWDENDDGVPENLDLASREVPGTQSLSVPGAIGSEFILVQMSGGSVKQLQSPSNDFSDI